MLQRLWDEFDGNCGICGDPYDEIPGANNNGGVLAEHIIGRYFQAGQEVEIILQFKGDHGGQYRFSICNNDDSSPLQQSCFDANPLKRKEDKAIDVMAPDKDIVYAESFLLPEGFTCDNCVMQFNYTSGNGF